MRWLGLPVGTGPQPQARCYLQATSCHCLPMRPRGFPAARNRGAQTGLARSRGRELPVCSRKQKLISEQSESDLPRERVDDKISSIRRLETGGTLFHPHC